MKTPRVLAALMLAACGSAFAGKPVPGCLPSRLVPFDTFMQGKFTVSVPFSIPVPVAYEPVAKAPVNDSFYSYWMPPKEVAESRKTGKLPVHTGYMYAKLSTSVAYEPEGNRFTIEDEDYTAQGGAVLRKEQSTVNGHSVLFMEVVDPRTQLKVYMLYIALNVDTNAAYLTSVPPGHDLAVGDCFWNYLKKTVLETGQQTAANQSRPR